MISPRLIPKNLKSKNDYKIIVSPVISDSSGEDPEHCNFVNDESSLETNMCSETRRKIERERKRYKLRKSASLAVKRLKKAMFILEDAVYIEKKFIKRSLSTRELMESIEEKIKIVEKLKENNAHSCIIN